jgi:hypothetical protein
MLQQWLLKKDLRTHTASVVRIILGLLEQDGGVRYADRHLIERSLRYRREEKAGPVTVEERIVIGR